MLAVLSTILSVNERRRRLIERANDHGIDVDMGGAGDSPDDRVGDVVGGERRHALVRLLRPLRIAAKAHKAELRLDEAWRDLGDADWPAKQLQA